jgi:hypothetical protein
MRTEQQVQKLRELSEQYRKLVQEHPERLRNFTGGKVPPAVSTIQAILTVEHCNLFVAVCDWVLGKDNKTDEVMQLIYDAVNRAETPPPVTPGINA